MTAIATSPAATQIAPAAPGRAARYRNLIAAEWAKFWAVPSTYWTLLAAAIPCVAVGIIVAQNSMSSWPGPHSHTHVDMNSFDALALTFNGFTLGQLAIASLGVMVITSEYASGLIRATLAAVPRRGSVLAAKAAVVALVAVTAGLLLSVAAFLPVQAILHQHHLGVSLFSPGGLRSVGAMGLYIGVIGLIGLAFGSVIRHTAGAFAAAFGLVFVLPGVASSLPEPWSDRIGKFLPRNLFQQLTAQHLHPEYLSRGWSLAVLVAYPVVLLTIATCLLRRRDV